MATYHSGDWHALVCKSISTACLDRGTKNPVQPRGAITITQQNYNHCSDKLLDVLSKREIIHKRSPFNALAKLSRIGCPNKFTTRLDHEIYTHTHTHKKKNPRATSQTLQASLSMLNLEVYNSTITRRRMNKFGLFGRVVRVGFQLYRTPMVHSF